MRKGIITIIACLLLAAAASIPWLTENCLRADLQPEFNELDPSADLQPEFNEFDPSADPQPELDLHVIDSTLWETFPSLSDEDCVLQTFEDGSTVPLKFTSGGEEFSAIHVMVDGEAFLFQFDEVDDDYHLVARRCCHVTDGSASYERVMDFGSVLDLLNEYRSQSAQNA